MDIIGYKTLRADGSSLNINGYGSVRYPLPRNGRPGAWIKVPGMGAYVAGLDGALFTGGFGDILVELECTQCLGAGSTPGVARYRRVRILRTVPWVELLPRFGQWRIKAAFEVPGLSRSVRRKLVMDTRPVDSPLRRFIGTHRQDISWLSKADLCKLLEGKP